MDPYADPYINLNAPDVWFVAWNETELHKSPIFLSLEAAEEYRALNADGDRTMTIYLVTIDFNRREIQSYGS